jgi:two-component system response regulator PhoP
MTRLLLVEDDPQVSLMVQDFLKPDYVIDTAADGADGLYLAETRDYDLYILDWELPSLTGIHILHELRARNLMAPVLMLTGRSHIEDKETGLDSGADDYLTKPFSLRELSARVRSLLRRPAALPANKIEMGNLVIDFGRRSVSIDGSELNLFAREYLVLEFLARNQEQLFNASQIIDKVWPMEAEVTELAVRTVVSRLRSKLEASGSTAQLETIRGLGYRLSIKAAPPL